MADDERLARLTELARQVWPELEKPAIFAFAESESSCAQLHDEGLEYIHVHPHPRALDALEAALLVLAGEGYFYVSRAKYTELHPPPPPWVEELAASWERLAEADKQARGKGYIETEYATACRENAAELRARARGGDDARDR